MFILKIRKYILLILITLLSFIGYSQIPTNQDCLGAIPVCQDNYYQANSFSYTGNYPNEINSVYSCLNSGERNSVWYIFTVLQSGDLAFSITPNNSSNDYDWAVYNLTHNTCAEIFTNSALEVSCNSAGGGGVTGANGLAGAQNNPIIPVLTGETYVISVNNWSSTSQNGYSLNFSASSATIFDNIPPEIDSVYGPFPCGLTTLDFSFSERILCTSLTLADLILEGPGGPYVLSNLYGAACASGGDQERYFSVDVFPPITTSGTFYLKLDATQASSVVDLCGNIAPTDSLVFSINNITSNTSLLIEDICDNCIGEASAFGDNGSAPYTYEWSSTPVQTTAIATNLCGDSTYFVTITDAGGCDITDSIYISGNSLNISITTTSEDFCGNSVGKAVVNIINGTSPFTYQWSTSPVQNTDTAFNLAGNQWYYVTVTDSYSCTKTDSIFINIIEGPNITISNTSNSSNGIGGWASTNTTGGTPPYTYLWSSSPTQTADSLINVAGGTYTVTVTDDNGCTDTIQVTIAQDNLNIQLQGENDECSIGSGSASVTVFNSIGNISYLWSTGDSTITISGLNAGTYSVTVTDTANIPITADITIGNTPGPTALFTAVPWIKTNIDPSIQFINNSIGATAYFWDFDDGTISTDDHPLHLYPILPMIYNVTLYATSDVGCIDSISRSVEIREELVLYMPNAFTPNGDGINEIAIPVLKEGTYIEGTYEFRIYNRWGELVFYTNDPIVGWDGNIKGKEAQNNTYIYTINIVEQGGIKKEYAGKISLLR